MNEVVVELPNRNPSQFQSVVVSNYVRQDHIAHISLVRSFDDLIHSFGIVQIYPLLVLEILQLNW